MLDSIATVPNRSTTSMLDHTPKRIADTPFFPETLEVGEHVASFEWVATIIWKRTPDGWRKVRWHASVISSDVPEELRAAS
jgi:hypothetical protein